MSSPKFSGKEFFCEICDQKFETSDGLQCHYLIHTSEYYEKQICHTCKDNCSCEKELKNHLRITERQSCADKKINHFDPSEIICQEDDSMPMNASKVNDNEEVFVISPENCNITNVYIFTDNSESVLDQNILHSIDIASIEQPESAEITVFVIPPGSSFESSFLETDVNKENTQQNENSDSCLSLSSDIVDNPIISSAPEKQTATKKAKTSFKKQHQFSSSHDSHHAPHSVANVSQPRVFKCTDCGKCYNHRLSLKSHQRNKHGSMKPYECFICEKAFALRKYLRKHIFTHSEDKPYQCKSCFKGFIRKDEFEIHMMIHRGETPPSKCKHCGKVCFSMSNLRNHILHHHKNPESYRHNCTVCNKKFAANYLLQRHLKTHSKSTNKFSCESCGLGFKSHKTLKLHMPIHTDVKVKES